MPEEEVTFAEKFSTDSLGLSKECFIVKREDRILVTVLENLFNDNEFCDFCQRFAWNMDLCFM